MFGFTAVEALQLSFDNSAAAIIDKEPWIANLKAMRRLKNLCLQPQKVEQVLVLSGDVHYGFHRYESYQHPVSPQRVHFWQLTSSAVCNIPPGSGLGQNVVEKWLPFLWKRVLHKFHKEKARYLRPDQSEHFIAADTNLGLLELDPQGLPERSFLLLADAATSKKWHWSYNLKKPRILS